MIYTYRQDRNTTAYDWNIDGVVLNINRDDFWIKQLTYCSRRWGTVVLLFCAMDGAAMHAHLFGVHGGGVIVCGTGLCLRVCSSEGLCVSVVLWVSDKHSSVPYECMNESDVFIL